MVTERERRTCIAPATMTSRRAEVVYRVERPAAGANWTPEAVSGIFVLARLIFRDLGGEEVQRSQQLIQYKEMEGNSRDA